MKVEWVTFDGYELSKEAATPLVFSRGGRDSLFECLHAKVSRW